MNAYPSPKMYPIKNVEIILIMDLYAILDQINCNPIKIWKWKCLIAELHAKLYPVDLIKAIKAIAASSPGKRERLRSGVSWIIKPSHRILIFIFHILYSILISIFIFFIMNVTIINFFAISSAGSSPGKGKG